MSKLHDNTLTLEIILGIVTAFGMMAMMLNPLLGKAMMGIALSLLFILYLISGLFAQDAEIDGHMQLMLNKVNFISSAITATLLLLILILLPGNKILALIAIGLSIICMTLNASNKYIYKIHDNDYLHLQIRLVLMIIMVIIMMLIKV